MCQLKDGPFFDKSTIKADLIYNIIDRPEEYIYILSCSE